MGVGVQGIFFLNGFEIEIKFQKLNQNVGIKIILK